MVTPMITLIKKVYMAYSKVHTNITQYANDGRIKNLTTEKSDKGSIGKTHGMDDKIRMLGIKNCVGEHFCLGNESLFICHQVQETIAPMRKFFRKLINSNTPAEIFLAFPASAEGYS